MPPTTPFDDNGLVAELRETPCHRPELYRMYFLPLRRWIGNRLDAVFVPMFYELRISFDRLLDGKDE